MRLASENALEFVRQVSLPPAPATLEAPEAPDVPLSQAKDQAAVVGSDIISFVSGVTAEQRQDLINCALLAQLVAKVQVDDRTRIYDWYQRYFDVLKQIGWVVQEEQFATYRASSLGFEAHEAIIGIATTLLGPSPAALAVVKATLDSLQSMDANSPWLTIFNRESQSGQTAHFQVTLVQPDDKGQFLVSLMAFGLEAKSTLTQVLFFKLHSSEDVLKHFSGKVSVDSEVLAAVRDDIRKKLSAHVSAYVRTLPDLDVASAPVAASLETAGLATEITADTATQQTDDADPAEIEAILAEEAIEAPGLTVASVKWNPKDDEQPDYRHLDTSLAGSSFDLTADDFDLLITANEFAPSGTKLVFALRGASLGGAAKRENVTSVRLTDQRPDHRAFRCVIGVYDRSAKMLSAYQASTVPNAAYVFKCYAMALAGTATANLTGNILPTGCYTYTVGPHHPGTPREIPTVLRLAQSVTDASSVVVLRSINDTIYDRRDLFVTAAPADNVHPGQMAQSFSSAGCLTLPGFYANGQHTGIWKDFRAALGLGPASNGTHYSLVLLTGLDAALASQVRAGARPVANITRLRHGSTGPRVAALQKALGMTPEANPQLGPVTRQALIARQTAKIGWADGIYSPAMDQLLGFDVYRSS